MVGLMSVVSVLGCCLAASPAASQPSPVELQPSSQCIDDAAVAAARSYARGRPGAVSFAVFERGTLRTLDGDTPYRSASLVKAMVLAAALRRQAQLQTPLSTSDRARLTTMIRVSGNRAATSTFQLVGRDAVVEVGRLVRMQHSVVGDRWGTSQVTASDQARLFGRLHMVLPRQYRAFGRRLLSTVVRKQTWGGARVARRRGYVTLFKPAWLKRSDGWLVHQGLRLERDGCTVGLAVLTGQQPDMSAGVETIHGVVERLL